MNMHLVKALADAYEAGGALAKFANDHISGGRITPLDYDDERYAKELRDHLQKMDSTLRKLLHPYEEEEE